MFYSGNKKPKKVVNKELRSCCLREEVTLKFDEKGNLVQRNYVIFD